MVPATPADETDPLPAFDPFLEDAFAAADRPGRGRTSGDAPSDPSMGYARPGETMAWDVDGWGDEASHGLTDHSPSDDDWDDDWTVAPVPVRTGRGPIDPLIARLGAVAIVATLAVSLIVHFTGGDTSKDRIVAAASTTTVPATIPALTTAQDVAPTTAAPPATAPSAAPSTAATTSPTTAAQTSSPTTASSNGETAAALETQVATTAAPACAAEYELAAGDYWIRIADAAGVRLADLLEVNGASVDTMLVPGRTICLPAGAETPAPPTAPATTATTVAPTNPPTTRAPTTTAPPTTAAPTTAAPTSTAAPTTTQPPPPPAEVEAIIREVWPDDLEERALQIAWRESNYIATAKNWCCYGLFQMHWNAHRSWLDGIGVTAPEQLFDARTNTVAAYTLYQRSGGFGPWGG